MSSPQEFIEAYAAAFETGDVEAMVALYADELRAFDAAEPSEYRDKESWTLRTSTWLLAFAGERRCDFHDIEIFEAEDIAAVTANIVLAGDLVGTDEKLELELRATFVLGRFGDELLVVHEHNSVPLEPDEVEWTEEDEAMLRSAMADGTLDGLGLPLERVLGDEPDLDVEGQGHRGGLISGDEDSGTSSPDSR